MRDTSRFGIYLNPKEKEVVRITSPYWIPEEREWVFLTDEVNSTLARIKEMVKERSLVSDHESIRWGSIPARD